MTIHRHRFDDAWAVLPDFGRIQHLPYLPNTDRDDLVATAEEAAIIFDPSLDVTIEEKVDGSQIGIASDGDGEPPLIRNKNHVLVKGYGRKNTPAKAQYAPLWNWVYENAKCFENLREQWQQPASVYGEWIYAEHTLSYDLAPSDFIAYNVFLPEEQRFVSPFLARNSLHEAGFTIPALLGNSVTSYAQLEALTKAHSMWSNTSLREGVIVKVSSTPIGAPALTHQFKMRRSDFKPREDFNDTPLRRRKQTG